MGSSPGMYLFCSLKLLHFCFFSNPFCCDFVGEKFSGGCGGVCIFSLFLFLFSLLIMPVVKTHSAAKRAQSIWDFTTKFPDSLTVDRYVYYPVLEARAVM